MKVDISSLRADIAVMDVFRRSGPRSGGRLSFEDLAEAWHGYHLRRGDLRGGIERLEAMGLLHVDERHGLSRVTITEQGRQWLESPMSLLRYPLLMPRRIVGGARAWSRIMPSAAPRRRVNDRPRDATVTMPTG